MLSIQAVSSTLAEINDWWLCVCVIQRMVFVDAMFVLLNWPCKSPRGITSLLPKLVTFLFVFVAPAFMSGCFEYKLLIWSFSSIEAARLV